ENLQKAAFYLTFASAVAILFSIAVSQSLLGLALAALFLSGARQRLPPIWLPLGLFLLGTVISLAFSPDPAAGLPQIRKFYVFLMVLVIFSTIRDLVTARRLFLCWTAAGALIACRGLVQFINKVQEAHALGRGFYDFYVADRITGFMSHWMTFSGQQMFELLMLMAFVFFAPDLRNRGYRLWLVCGFVIAIVLVLGDTRSIIYLAFPVGALYLLWFWKRWLMIAIPAVILLAIWVAPGHVHQRFVSIFQPQKNTDSNGFRLVALRTGWRMVEAHPWLGLGPEEVKAQFLQWVPADIPRPLPTGYYGHLHNIYVQYAAERGIPTMLMLLWMLLQILYDFGRTLGQLPPGRSNARFLLHGGIACVIATMLGGLFELNLGDSEPLTMFLVIVTCGYLAVEKTREAVPAPQ
ncbi:MAG: O-antigen ligase family protein, partial [Acidobacteriota bacterium]|nr:O-antigen ligase family protein [Acidobacteriota bacterium]